MRRGVGIWETENKNRVLEMWLSGIHALSISLLFWSHCGMKGRTSVCIRRVEYEIGVLFVSAALSSKSVREVARKNVI